MQWTEGMLVATEFKDDNGRWLRIIRLLSVHPDGKLAVTDDGDIFSYNHEEWAEAKPFPVGYVQKRWWGWSERWVYGQQKEHV